MILNANRKAFTLIELALVFLILTMLMLITFFGVRYYIVRATEARVKKDVEELQVALRLYKDDSEDGNYPIETTPGGRSIALALQDLVTYEYLSSDAILRNNPNVLYVTNADGSRYWISFPIETRRDEQTTTSGAGIYATNNSGGNDVVALEEIGRAIRFSHPERIDPTPNNIDAGMVINNPRNPSDRGVVAPGGPPPGHARFYDSASFSTSLWFRARALKPYEPLILKRVIDYTNTGCGPDTGCPLLMLGDGWQVGLTQSGSRMQLRVNGRGIINRFPAPLIMNVDFTVTNSNFLIETDRWYHLVITQSRSEAPINIFLNGVHAGSTPNAPALNAAQSHVTKATDNHPYFFLGWGPIPNQSSPWVGAESDIDDLRHYAAALNLGQIQAIFNNGRGAPGSRTEPNSVTGWSFDETPGENADSAVFTDYVGFQTNLVSIVERTSNSINLRCRSSRTTAIGCTADSLNLGNVSLSLRGLVSTINRAFVVTGR